MHKSSSAGSFHSICFRHGTVQVPNGKTPKNKPEKQHMRSKMAFTLDRSAVETARQLSRKLDEVPQQGSCPFMTPSQLNLPSSGKAQSKGCPFSSANATHAQSSARIMHPDTHPVCPVSTSSLPASQAAAKVSRSSSLYGHLAEPEMGELSQAKQLEAPSKCPFHFQQQPSITVQATEASVQAQGDSNCSHGEAMTDEVLREYEQAFAVEPDEAMLQAYASLLAGKVAEADKQPDETPNHEANSQSPSCSSSQHQLPLTAGPHAQADKQPQQLASVHQKLAKGHSSELHSTCNAAEQAPAHVEVDPQSAGSSRGAAASSTAAADSDSKMQDRSQECQRHIALNAASGIVTDGSDCAVHRMQSCWHFLKQHSATWRVLKSACFGVQLVLTLYFGLVHQRCVFLWSVPVLSFRNTILLMLHCFETGRHSAELFVEPSDPSELIATEYTIAIALPSQHHAMPSHLVELLCILVLCIIAS